MLRVRARTPLTQEATGRIRVKDHDDLNSTDSQGPKDKWIDLKFIVKIEPKELPNGLHIECKGSRGIKHDLRLLAYEWQ